MPKIYDTCIFFNELDMLELRMNILAPVVDYFVVCEAEETHSGHPKRLNFLDNYDRFELWRNKIIYVNAGPLSNGQRTSWERERYHRSRIAEGLRAAHEEDWIIVSDCDEIPNPAHVAELRHLPSHRRAAKFELTMYYYDLNHRVNQGWAICAERNSGAHNPNDIRTGNVGYHAAHMQTYLDGGWHFSYFGGPDAILEKHAAFMHAGDPVIRDMPRDSAFVEQQIAASLDLYGRDLQIEHVPTADNLPRYVLDNIEQFRAKGWIE